MAKSVNAQDLKSCSFGSVGSSPSPDTIKFGRLAEWFKASALKTEEPEKVPQVRILYLPQFSWNEET